MIQKILFSFFAIYVSSNLILSAQTPYYGLAMMGGNYNKGSIYKVSSDSSTVSTEFSFNAPDGWSPRGSLHLASNGLMYGACYEGGDYYSCTIFSFDPASGYCTDIYDFDITNGDFPESGPVEGPGGLLWGVAPHYGGSGCGVIYKVDMATNAYSAVHFLSDLEGCSPKTSPLVVGPDKIYGTAYPDLFSSNKGIIYSYNTILDDFQMEHVFDSVGGSYPWGGLVQGSDGKLYGLTYLGGMYDNGVLYSYHPAGSVFTVLHHFTSSDGSPGFTTPVIMDNVLYGATMNGGSVSAGRIFKYDLTTGTYANLHDFAYSEGLGQKSQLTASNDGYLYGTCYSGGSPGGVGTIYKFHPSTLDFKVIGVLDNLYGAYPTGAVITDSPVTSLDFPSGADLFSVSPNPAADHCTLSYRLRKPGRVTARLYSVSGQLVREIRSESASGQNALTLPVADLAPGLYSCMMQTPDGSMNAKVVVQ